jgi:hypothetical protein
VGLTSANPDRAATCYRRGAIEVRVAASMNVFLRIAQGLQAAFPAPVTD